NEVSLTIPVLTDRANPENAKDSRFPETILAGFAGSVPLKLRHGRRTGVFPVCPVTTGSGLT
ncbi:MAG: hypothetical protein ACREJB_19300, partial [Planctomycetaceae bacterium]